MKVYKLKFKKNYVALNRILWIGAVVTTFFLVYLTGYQGDLDYYLNVDDGSARNTFMTLVVSPLTFISTNPQTISYIWLTIASLFLFKATKQLTLIFFIYLFLTAPFLLLPSKDGLAFIFAMIVLISNKNVNQLLKISIYLLILLLRPFYGFLILYLIIIILFNKKIRLSAYVLIGIFFMAILFLVETLNQNSISAWLSYAIGYYSSATEAGSTDWLFINSFDPEVNLLSNSLLVIGRAFFPVWMIVVGSLTGWAYFFIYIYCILYSVEILRHHSSDAKINNSYFKITCILILVLIPAAPLLITNGGSAARYISLLPSICLLLRKESE